MQLENKRIGIFDSGVGGLAIAQVIWQSLPEYSYIYLGDTKHVPFGDRSQEVIYEYTRQAVEYLFKQNCQLIILACNTASAEALRRIQQEYLPIHYPDRRVLGVIIPTIEAALRLPDSQVETEPREVLGVMATSSTVESGAYGREALKMRPNLQIIQLATPLLVPIIERGELDLTDNLLKQYLEYFKSQKVQKLILGCTHYVLLKDKIRKLADWPVEIIAQDEIIPLKLKDYLNRHPEITGLLEKNSQCEILVTDLTEGIKSLMGRFICVHQESKVELVKLQEGLEPPSIVKKEVAASTITTMKNGGKVKYLAEPKDLEELKSVLDWAKTQALNLKIIGGGSDVLLAEAGFEGLLLHPSNRTLEFLEGGKVRVGAGMPLGQLVALSLQKGLAGLEYFARIPCQVGGAIYNNIHGLEGRFISQLVTEVTSIDLNQFLVKHFQPQELDFAYDQSIFQQNAQLIYEVTLQLQPQSEIEIQARRAYYLEQTKIKSQKQPAGPNVGSVFKNLPEAVEGDNKAAAWYIDQCGLKGLQVGGMQVDLKHANFIVNVDHGTQTDFISLVKQIQARVQDKFGFRLEPEVECWQEDGEKIRW